MTHHPSLKTGSETPGSSTFLRAALLVAAIVAFVLLVGANPATNPPTDCTLAFEPTSVAAASGSEEVRMTPSEEVPAPDSVTFLEESGLSGELVEERPWSLMVHTNEARIGEWTVTVHENELPTCSGVLVVTEDG